MSEESLLELIPIGSETRTIQTCFQQCLYEVPNFQRPYSWTEDQLQEFWEDLVLAKSDFFFGSTVTWVSKKRDLFNDTYSIIDGQQRLTTSAILLSVIRDFFLQIATQSAEGSAERGAATSQGNVTQRYLIISDDDGREYRVLDRPEPMFYEEIQNPSAIPSGAEWNGSASRIGDARRYFEDRMTAALEGLSEQQKIDQLKVLRANVLKARVIQIELSSEEDGFLIFETLNTRGADLRLADLVKNLLVRGGATTSKNRAAISTRWDRLVTTVQFGRSDQSIVDRFIWQSWNSRREAVREPALFKTIREHVRDDAGAHLAFLEELEDDAKVYEWLDRDEVPVQSNVAGQRNAFSVPEFVDAIRALSVFNISVSNSAVLSIARRYRANDRFTRRQLIEAISLIEKFHFQFSALMNSGSTGGTRARYNLFAVSLETATSKQDITRAIQELRTKLQTSLPKPELTAKAFRELFYAPNLKLNQAQKPRARKIFIAYILMAFAKFHKLQPAGTDPSAWSIEHIRPQSVAEQSVRDMSFSIGNLVLLTPGMNSLVGDGTLTEKAESLRAGCAYFDSSLIEWTENGAGYPSDEQIAERAKQLSKEAFENVWSI